MDAEPTPPPNMLMARPQPRTPLPRHRPLRVLAVLSDEEIHACFPDEMLGNLRHLAGDFAHAPPELDISRDLAQVFDRVHPDVLIAGASTPPLPEKLPATLRYVCCVSGSVARLVRREHLERGLLVTRAAASGESSAPLALPQRRAVGAQALRNLRAFIEHRALEAVVRPDPSHEEK